MATLIMVDTEELGLTLKTQDVIGRVTNKNMA